MNLCIAHLFSLKNVSACCCLHWHDISWHDTTLPVLLVCAEHCVPLLTKPGLLLKILSVLILPDISLLGHAGSAVMHKAKFQIVGVCILCALPTSHQAC